MRIKRRETGERDRGLSEEEICRRLRHEIQYSPEAEDVMERAADCIERLAAFRDSFNEIRLGLDLKIARLGEENDRLEGVIADYAKICEQSSSEIRMLRQRLFAITKCA